MTRPAQVEPPNNARPVGDPLAGGFDSHLGHATVTYWDTEQGQAEQEAFRRLFAARSIRKTERGRGIIMHCAYCEREVSTVKIAQSVGPDPITHEPTYMCVNDADCLAAITMGQTFATLSW